MADKFNSKLMVIISDLDKMQKSMKKEIENLKAGMKEMNKKMDQILKKMK